MSPDASGRCRARPSARARRLRVNFVVDFCARICDSSGARSGCMEALLRAQFFVPPSSFYCSLENLPGLPGNDDDVRAAASLSSRDVGDARVVPAYSAHSLVPDSCVLNLREAGFLFLALVGELVGVDDTVAVLDGRLGEVGELLDGLFDVVRVARGDVVFASSVRLHAEVRRVDEDDVAFGRCSGDFPSVSARGVRNLRQQKAPAGWSGLFVGWVSAGFIWRGRRPVPWRWYAECATSG